MIRCFFQRTFPRTAQSQGPRPLFSSHPFNGSWNQHLLFSSTTSQHPSHSHSNGADSSISIADHQQQHQPEEPCGCSSCSLQSTSLSTSAILSPSSSSFLSAFDPLSPSAPILCAVPKRKTSVRVQRNRRAGQRAQKAKRLYVNYRICLNCGSAVKPHFLCEKCRQVIARF